MRSRDQSPILPDTTMSEEQLKAFIEKVQGDDNLQVKLKGAANSDAVVSIAKEAGFSISADDLRTQSEISEEELEGKAGGRFILPGDVGVIEGTAGERFKI